MTEVEVKWKLRNFNFYFYSMLCYHRMSNNSTNASHVRWKWFLVWCTLYLHAISVFQSLQKLVTSKNLRSGYSSFSKLTNWSKHLDTFMGMWLNTSMLSVVLITIRSRSAVILFFGQTLMRSLKSATDFLLPHY